MPSYFDRLKDFVKANSPDFVKDKIAEYHKETKEMDAAAAKLEAKMKEVATPKELEAVHSWFRAADDIPSLEEQREEMRAAIAEDRRERASEMFALELGVAQAEHDGIAKEERKLAVASNPTAEMEQRAVQAMRTLGDGAVKSYHDWIAREDQRVADIQAQASARRTAVPGKEEELRQIREQTKQPLGRGTVQYDDFER